MDLDLLTHVIANSLQADSSLSMLTVAAPIAAEEGGEMFVISAIACASAAAVAHAVSPQPVRSSFR